MEGCLFYDEFPFIMAECPGKLQIKSWVPASGAIKVMVSVSPPPNTVCTMTSFPPSGIQSAGSPASKLSMKIPECWPPVWGLRKLCPITFLSNLPMCHMVRVISWPALTRISFCRISWGRFQKWSRQRYWNRLSFLHFFWVPILMDSFSSFFSSLPPQLMNRLRRPIR